MKVLFNKIVTVVLCTIFCLTLSCNKTAPIQNDGAKSSFRSDWENSYKNYTNSPEDVADSMPGDDGGAMFGCY